MLTIPGFGRCGGERSCSVAGGGFLGVFIGFFCPLCVPASAALFSAIGLAVLPQKVVIFPLIAVFAVVLLVGLWLGLRRHSDLSPLLFGVVGVLAVPLGRYIIGSALMTYTGAFCVVAAAVWNVLLQSAPVEQRVTEADVQELLKHTTV